MRFEVDDHVATVWLHRPHRHNAWTGRMHREYREVLAHLHDDPAVRAVVATEGRIEVAARPRAMAVSEGVVLVRPTLALVTPLEREVVRGLGSAAAGGRVLGHACVGVIEDASRAPEFASAGIVRGARVAVQPVFSCGRCERCMGTHDGPDWR